MPQSARKGFHFPGGAALTLASFVALAAGLGLGLVLHRSEPSGVVGLSRALEQVGGYWILLLRLTVIPVVVTRALGAVTAERQPVILSCSAG